MKKKDFDKKMPDDKEEFSKGGSRIYRHNKIIEPKEQAEVNSNFMELFENHIEKNIGKIENVFHEISSDFIHVDIYIITPTKEKPYYTLVTSGMSSLPQTVPPKFRGM